MIANTFFFKNAFVGLEPPLLLLGWGAVSPRPPRFLRHCTNFLLPTNIYFHITLISLPWAQFNSDCPLYI